MMKQIKQNKIKKIKQKNKMKKIKWNKMKKIKQIKQIKWEQIKQNMMKKIKQKILCSFRLYCLYFCSFFCLLLSVFCLCSLRCLYFVCMLCHIKFMLDGCDHRFHSENPRKLTNKPSSYKQFISYTFCTISRAVSRDLTSIIIMLFVSTNGEMRYPLFNWNTVQTRAGN